MSKELSHTYRKLTKKITLFESIYTVHVCSFKFAVIPQDVVMVESIEVFWGGDKLLFRGQQEGLLTTKLNFLPKN